MLRELVEAGGDISARNIISWAVVNFAVVAGFPTEVREVVELGADLNLQGHCSHDVRRWVG